MRTHWSLTSIRLASLVFFAACAETPIYKEAFVLVEDNRLRCEDVVSDVLTQWEQRFSTPESSINAYYAGDGRLKIAPMEVRLAQSREALSRTSKRSGEVRDLLVDFYAGVEKLCGLAKSPVGYSRLTFNDRRSALRDEIAGAKAKLEILLPIAPEESAKILERFLPAIQEAEKRVQRELVAEKRRSEAREREARLHAEAAIAARKRLDAEESQAIERVASEKAEQTHLEQEMAKERVRQAELARQGLEKERREYLRSTSQQARIWFDKFYATFDQFCTTANRLAIDVQASKFERSQECAILEEAVTVLRGRSPESAVPQEIAILVNSAFDSYERGAKACLEKNVLATVHAFTRGQKACTQLHTHVSEYDFDSQ